MSRIYMYLRVYSFCGYTFLWINTKMQMFVHANKLTAMGFSQLREPY